MEVFQDYAFYYNAFYKDKDYKTEAKQIDLLLNKYSKLDQKKIINYGCGTGRHDIELSKLGYCCKGIDISKQMIDIARENAKNENQRIDLSIADIRRYVPVEKYEAVISLFHVISYQNSNEDVLAVFKAARKALREGGLFLFDVWYGPGVLSDKPSVRVKEVCDDQYELIRIARPVMCDKTNVVDVCYKVLIIDKISSITSIINERHSMRYFFRPELEMFLKQTGFEFLDGFDCKTLGETDYNSWTSFFVAKAI